MPHADRRAMPRLVLATALVTLLAAAPARAGDPILPLAAVTPGMNCVASTVLQGTTITRFSAQVVDVVEGDPAADAPRILVRFSGPEIEPTGVGPGFSGSPIHCDGKVIGAISESIGEYGGLLALATPIEAIIGQPVEPPPATSPTPPNARQLKTPLSVSGLSPRIGRLLSRAARREGEVVLATPGLPRAAAFAVQPLVPGSSMAAGLSSGDVTAGAVGTVSYVDGDRVWGFGHPLDGTGRRSLFLQDAYVYSIVNNPVGVEGAGTYKLAVPGHDVGILSGDGFSAVAGRTGVLPDRFGMKVVAADQDTGRRRTLDVTIADETALENPTGVSPLSLVGSGTVAQAASTVLGSSPARQTGEMCVRFAIRERRAPLRFCNRYVVRTAADSEEGLGAGAPMVGDFAEAVTAIDEFNFATLHITGVEVNLKLRRGLKQAFMLDAEAPRVVRRGRTARVRVKVQEIRGRPRWRTLKVPVPRDLGRGEHALVLQGTPSDAAGGLEADLGELLFGEGGAPGEGEVDEAGPRTVEDLAEVVAGIGRFDGVTAAFVSEEDDLEGVEGRPVLRDPAVRLSGTVQVPVRVR
jgi:hypothetical protein